MLPLSLLEQLCYRRPLQVTRVLRIHTSQGTSSYPLCPRCAISLDRDYIAFCDRCGQMLDWSSFSHASPVSPPPLDHEAGNPLGK